MIIGITGNIGSGKSAAAEIFRKNGYKVINADSIGHELYRREDIKTKVVKEFGQDILSNNEISRVKLKKIVFYNPEKLKKLNSIVHPEIIKKIKNKITHLNNVVIDAALIVEVDFKCDKLILITIDKDIQMKRLLKKGKYTKEEINNILTSQLPQEEKIKHADFIVDNSGSKEELEENIGKIIRALTS